MFPSTATDQAPASPRRPPFPFPHHVLLLLAFVFVSAACTTSREASRIDTTAVTFATPMTVLNPAELAIVRDRIDSGAAPQNVAYRRMLREADAALEFTPAPPVRLHVMGGYQVGSNLNEVRDLMEREANAAYVTALAWLYSGDERYAAKSTEILRAWTDAGTRFTGMDRGLQLGSWFNRMLYAADLLKSSESWQTSHAAVFESWWRREVLPHVVRVATTRRNNWQEAGVLGVLTAAVVFEDPDLLALGLTELDRYFLPRNGLIHRGADWKFAVMDETIYLPREVKRRGGERGVTYTAYSLTSLVQAMEIARYAGFDWWDREAPNGATLLGVVDTYYRWNVLAEPFPWHNSPRQTDLRQNPFEIIHNHFPGRIAGLDEWLDHNRPVNGRQGDPYVTLNRGNISSRN